MTQPTPNPTREDPEHQARSLKAWLETATWDQTPILDLAATITLRHQSTITHAWDNPAPQRVQPAATIPSPHTMDTDPSHPGWWITAQQWNLWSPHLHPDTHHAMRSPALLAASEAALHITPDPPTSRHHWGPRPPSHPKHAFPSHRIGEQTALGTTANEALAVLAIMAFTHAAAITQALDADDIIVTFPHRKHGSITLTTNNITRR